MKITRITATAIFAVTCTAAAADPLTTAIGNAAKAFDTCFYHSVAAQLKASKTVDYDMASENSFVACSTEETAMALLIKSAGVSREQATILLTGKHLALKQRIRDIAADAKAKCIKAGGAGACNHM
jgi:hypothetical protein